VFDFQGYFLAVESFSFRSLLDDIGSFVSSGLQGRPGNLSVLELADKGVRIFGLVEVTECVVDTSVDGFVSPDVKDQVLHRAVLLWHLPVLDSNVGNAKLGVVPLGQVTVLDLLNAAGVGMDGLLLKISDKSVNNLGGDEVRDEKTVEEDALSSNDHHLHEPARLAHLHECQEVHPLVVALLEECLDPTVVSLHASKTSEVAQHAADHAWNSGDALQEDETHQPLRLGKRLLCHNRSCWVLLVNLLFTIHARGLVHAPSGKAHNLPGHPVTFGSGLSVGRYDSSHLLVCLGVVRPCWLGLLDMGSLLHGEEVTKLGGGC